MQLSLRSETQPDVALLRLRADDYALRHPGPEDVVLVVEVADTTRRWDSEHRVPLYAAAGVGEVWLVDVMAEEVEVLRSTEGGGYRDVALARPGDAMAPGAFADIVFDVAELLPSAGDAA